MVATYTAVIRPAHGIFGYRVNLDENLLFNHQVTSNPSIVQEFSVNYEDPCYATTNGKREFSIYSSYIFVLTEICPQKITTLVKFHFANIFILKCCLTKRLFRRCNQINASKHFLKILQ